MLKVRLRRRFGLSSPLLLSSTFCFASLNIHKIYQYNIVYAYIFYKYLSHPKKSKSPIFALVFNPFLLGGFDPIIISMLMIVIFTHIKVAVKYKNHIHFILPLRVNRLISFSKRLELNAAPFCKLKNASILILFFKHGNFELKIIATNQTYDTKI